MSGQKPYETSCFRYARQDSNLRPLAPEFYFWVPVPTGLYRLVFAKTP